VKVAAYQAPLHATSQRSVLGLIREQIEICESQGVEILCCPEGVLGGLADYVSRPSEIAINVESGQLQNVLAPLASGTVTTILGFTEIDLNGRLYNSAAVLRRGIVIRIYRKLYPAIRRSVYDAGEQMPVFVVDDYTFGVLICRDSNYAEPARMMAAQGATVLFVPTNNGLPPEKAGPELVAEARNTDVARARENNVYVVRADVAGRVKNLVSYGSTGIVDPEGKVLVEAKQLEPCVIVADISLRPQRVPAQPGEQRGYASP
jgi:predicted amidohydrolase